MYRHLPLGICKSYYLTARQWFAARTELIFLHRQPAKIIADCLLGLVCDDVVQPVSFRIYRLVGINLDAVSPAQLRANGCETSVNPGEFRMMSEPAVYLVSEIQCSRTFRKGHCSSLRGEYCHVFIEKRVVDARHEHFRILRKFVEDRSQTFHPLFLAFDNAAEIGLLPHVVRTDMELLDVAVWVQELEMD